jgi:hypothetical protein
MPPSFSCVISTKIVEEKQAAIDNMNAFMSHITPSSIEALLKNVSPIDINYALFVSEPEEGEFNQQDNFFVPKIGKLVYAGLGGKDKSILINQTITSLVDTI